MVSATTAGVRRTVLDNGLTVLIKENHAAPVAGVVVHVNIGYFNEPDRWSGIAHVVEHMLFKGTARRPGKEEIAQAVRGLGGTINAGTGYEDTDYYIVLPSEHVEGAVEVLADMLQNSLLDPDELAKELEVIIQESRQKRDNPGAMLVETMYARAFDHHRIRRWRIGEELNLRAMRRADLAAFIDQTYRPENMVVSVVGDVHAARAIEMVARAWERAPRGELHRELSPDEPKREGMRYFRMRGPIQQKLFVFGFRSPPVLHERTPALRVLAGILADGRSARLYRALKEEQRLVNSVWADQDAFQQIGVFTLGAEVIADDPLPAQTALFQEIRRVVDETIDSDELQRVKTRIESRRLFAQEEVLGVARTLARYQALGDYRLWDEMLERLRCVGAADLQRSAADLLSIDAATLVEYLPADACAPERATFEIDRALKSVLPQRSAWTPQANVEVGETLDQRLVSGAQLLFRRRDDLPIVALHVLFPGGRRAESLMNAGVTNLMLKSALKGTESWSAQEIAERVEGLGSGIGLTLAPDYFGFSMKIIASRLNEGLEVLQEVIRRPTFPAEELEREKLSIFAEIRRQRDSMFSRALELFSAACFGDQPYGLPSSGLEVAIRDLTRTDLQEWHERWTRGGAAVIGAIGDMDPAEIALLLEHLVPGGDLTQPPGEGSRFRAPAERVDRIERHQTAAVMGFPGASYNNDDRHVLDLLAEITSGLAGRFFQAVRGDNALAYAVTSFHRARKDVGYFGTYTATAPENEQKARDILLAECEKLGREPVTEAELAGAKEAIRGEQAVHMQTFGAQAGELAAHRLYGMPIDESDRYLARIQAVTAEECQDIARRYLRPDAVWLGIVRGEKE